MAQLDGWLTLSEASFAARRTPITIRRWVRLGRVRAIKVGNLGHLYSRDDIVHVTRGATPATAREEAAETAGTEGEGG